LLILQDEQGLYSKAQKFGTEISSSARNHENILIICHHDADGLCSAALCSNFVFKNGGHCEIRAVSEPSIKSLERIAQAKFDLVLFLDIGSGLSKEIEKHLGDRWLIIDHHSIPDTEKSGESASRILNPWQFDIDGSTEVSCAALMHYVCEKANLDASSYYAIVGALADGQDMGPKRSLIGLNAKILQNVQATSRSVTTKADLLFFGRETRPIHEAVASTTSCFLPGLTGNKDACLASLRGEGVELKFNARWKTVADFSEEEKQQILAAILPHLSGTTSTVEDLVGTVYSLNSVDEFSPMHDARDFGTVLNACGRMGKASFGIMLCLEAGSDLSNEAEKVIADYRSELVHTVQTIVASPDRILDKQHYSIILGDGIVSEKMTGIACQALSTLNRFKGKIVFLRTTTSDGEVKVSARLAKGADVDLGLMLQSIASFTSGVGGGHKNKAGARFSIAKQQEFQEVVDAQFQTVRS
jgi:single-stranded-DNA-specific exonuclease